MRTRRQHPSPRSATQHAHALTIMDVIAAEAAALKLAVAACDDADTAYTLANLAELVRQTQRQLLDDHTINTVAPGTWRSGSTYALPKHTRNR
ncbi:hypothetical protein [Actinomyces succiniciruminis]|uniref:Uncharacterized protein n=1 Tax=Actinomyces succiniciruminis TaxID=1522002 RepID=A0A1L7RMA1_9ACTO|nr:hypothetical protein [Actinomyces succiniciruminis]CED91320.1 Hypothetical protein AAM4_1488 [Actinomyces succiniciruminis]